MASINVLPQATTAERDADYTSVPNGSQFYNTDTSVVETTSDGGSTWKTVLNMDVPFTTKGDLLVRNLSGDNVRLPAGGQGEILTADLFSNDGMRWGLTGTINIRSGDDVNIFCNDINTTAEKIEFIEGQVGVNFTPCLTILANANGPIAVGDLVTQSTTNFFVRAVTALDVDSQGVIGVATTASTNPGDVITMCVGPVVRCKTDSISTVAAGDPIEKSDTDDGKVQNTVASVGTVGIAAQAAGPSSDIVVWLRKNESF